MIISNFDLFSFINIFDLFVRSACLFRYLFFFISRNIKLEGPPPFYDFDPKKHQKKNQSDVAGKTRPQSLSQKGNVVVFLESYIWSGKRLVVAPSVYTMRLQHIHFKIKKSFSWGEFLKFNLRAVEWPMKRIHTISNSCCTKSWKSGDCNVKVFILYNCLQP